MLGDDLGQRPNSAGPSSDHRLLEDGEIPNDWTVLAVWAGDDA